MKILISSLGTRQKDSSFLHEMPWRKMASSTKYTSDRENSPDRSFDDQRDDTCLRLKSARSFIRPSTAGNIHGRIVKKCDPVDRYHMYREMWEAQPPPGEVRHSSLRWAVREQMLAEEPSQQPTRMEMSSDYRVPTQKTRHSLRWQMGTSFADSNR